MEVDGSQSNALAALKAWYVNIYGFCEAHDAQFTVEHAVDQEGGGFFLRQAGDGVRGEVSGHVEHTTEASAEASGTKLRRPWRKATPVDTDRDKADELYAAGAAKSVQPTSAAAAAGSGHSDPNAMKVADLKSLLRGLGLPLSGTKKELVERLADHQRGEMYSWSNRID